MKTISLTQGKVTLVDDEDYARFCRFKWHAAKRVAQNRVIWYAARSVRESSVRIRTIYMHREIAAVSGLPEVDHCDGNGLNNQRQNLRPASVSENLQNQAKEPGCSSQFKGVYWDKGVGKWRARIKAHGQRKHLGFFVDEEAAADAYDCAALLAFGEFALTNRPKSSQMFHVEQSLNGVPQSQ